MISSTFPYPPNKGRIQLRTFNLLKYLSENNQITLVTHDNNITNEEQNLCQEWVTKLVIFPEINSSVQQKGILNKAKQLGTFIQQGTPPEILANYSQEMQEWLDKAISHENFDIITCEHSFNEIYVRAEWQEKIPTVINIHNSIYGMQKNQINQVSETGLGEQLNLPLLRRYEQQYCSKFSAIVTTTNNDRKLLQSLVPEAKITVIPNGVDLNSFPKRVGNSGGQRIIFIGAMDNPANIDAVSFFSLEVFPEIKKRYPEAILELVGSRPVPEILALGEIDGIKVIGEVISIVEYLHWATVCVIPMRQGFGLRNKTLEAMAAGIPVVASDIALAGLKVDGHSVPLRAMRANSIDEYVYSIGRLFTETKLREKLSENARDFVVNKHSWEQMGKMYEELLLETINN